jgi:hypothetical protein
MKMQLDQARIKYGQESNPLYPRLSAPSSLVASLPFPSPPLIFPLYRHCEYQSLLYLQVYGASHVLQPV